VALTSPTCSNATENNMCHQLLSVHSD
jgi:hypothetical protein